MHATTRCLIPFGLLSLLCACGGSESGTGNDGQAALTDFNAAYHDYVVAITRGHEDAVAAVSAATQDFQYTLDEMAARPMSQATVDAYTDALIEAATSARLALVKAHAMVAAGAQLPVDAGSVTTPLRSVPVDEDTDRVQSAIEPFTLIILGAIAGGAMLNRALHETMNEATEARAAPVVDKIDEATDEEIAVMAEALDLPAGTDKQGLLDAIDGKGSVEKLEAIKAVEADLAIASVEKANVAAVDADEIRAAVLTGAVKCGQCAVVQVAGSVASVTGGQGITNVLEAMGISATAAAAVDLTVSVKGWQPLDLFAKFMNITVVSQDKARIAVVSPPSSAVGTVSSLTEAIQILQNMDAPADQVAVAADRVVEDMVEKAADAPINAQTESDGSVSVEVPTGVQAASVTNPKGDTTLQFASFGLSNVLVSANGFVPAVAKNVDTSDDATVTYAATAIADYGVAAEPDDEPEQEAPDKDNACAYFTSWYGQTGPGGEEAVCDIWAGQFEYCAEEGPWLCTCDQTVFGDDFDTFESPYFKLGQWDVTSCSGFCRDMHLGSAVDCDGSSDRKAQIEACRDKECPMGLCVCSDDFFPASTDCRLNAGAREACFPATDDSWRYRDTILARNDSMCVITTAGGSRLLTCDGVGIQGLSDISCGDSDPDTVDVCDGTCETGTACQHIAVEVPGGLSCTEADDGKERCLDLGETVPAVNGTSPLTMTIRCQYNSEDKKGEVVKGQLCRCEPSTTWQEGSPTCGLY